MTTYRRTEIGLAEEIVALAAGALVGAAAFYVARLWLQRELLPPPGGPVGDRREGEGDRNGGRGPEATRDR